ncbi:hypothetical protein RJ640_025528 [Escallonia rubra]|uniref:Zinc knuckle CX2CX4HX4C domain-containing protein n=1 Tax=Escallonia rubra TaxID=112253 RepID=A0AA88RZU6_9ASTE|nr:hypothetical protein RJ640_025528 [Escallonia rubra]
MDHRPWSVMGSHVVVRDWPHQLNLDEIEFKQSPFWIRVMGLPPILMTKQNAEKIGSKIGKVLEVDFTADGNLAWLRFLRIQVQIDISKPLHTGFNRIKDNRQKMWIRLQYERLPDFYFSCGRLGHTDRNCPHKPSIPPETMASPYGPWLRADKSDECPRYAYWSPAPVSTQTPQTPSMEANSVQSQFNESLSASDLASSSNPEEQRSAEILEIHPPPNLLPKPNPPKPLTKPHHENLTATPYLTSEAEIAVIRPQQPPSFP